MADKLNQFQNLCCNHGLGCAVAVFYEMSGML